MDQHYIDNIFREELENLAPDPPVESWMVISRGIRHPLRKRLMPVLGRVAAVLFLMAVSGATFWLTVLRPSSDLPGFADALSVSRLEPAKVSVLPTGTPRMQLASLTPLQRVSSSSGISPNQDESLVQPFGANEFSLPVVFPTGLEVGSSLQSDPIAHSLESVPGSKSLIGELVQGLSKGSGYPVFALGVHYASQYNNVAFSSGTSGGGQPTIPFQALEDQILTHSLGLSAHIKVNSRWAIQTGLNYREMGQYVRDIYSYARSDNQPLFTKNSPGSHLHLQSIITSQGNVRLTDPGYYLADRVSYRVLSPRSMSPQVPMDLIQRAEGLTQRLRFIEVPVIARYTLIRQRFDVQLKAGFSGSYLVGNTVFLGNDVTGAPIGETSGIRQYHFSALGGFSFDIPISGRLKLHLEPTAQLYLHPVVHEGLISQRSLPYNFSLQTGITYGF